MSRPKTSGDADYSSDYDLEGWGEIASHLGTSMDSARRWAAKGLPVKRLRHTGGVVASSAALSAWLTAQVEDRT